MESTKSSALSKRSELLDCLWSFQDKKGYISDADIVDCAKRLDLSRVEVEGVLSFYHFFTRTPRGKYTVYLNNSIVSEHRGYQRIREALEKETGSSFDHPEPTDLFGLYETPCIGLSDQEPAALINFYPFTNLNSLKIRDIVQRLRQGVDPKDICDEIPDNIRFVPPSDRAIIFREYYPGIALERIKDLTAEDVLQEIHDSGLRGMGGAFFPTSIKWKACRDEPAEPKFIVCNADEGEPGTFKDRVLLNSLAGLLLEGMAVAAYVTGAKYGIIYLRAEYIWLRDKINKTIEQFRRMHLLGDDILGIPGFSFDIRLQIGAGAYVCGEETALLNSLEGKRGEPRTKFFFPTQKGYLDKPTVVNNVETLCVAARIVQLGARQFKQRGFEGSYGTKLISVSGDCHAPGIYELEWGTPVSRLLELAKADDPYFIQVSGPSGECINIDESNRVFSYDDLKCGGSFMIFNDRRNILEVLANFADFFSKESCGVCTPCRAGNYIVRQKLQKMELGIARNSDLEEIRHWGEIMKNTSRCGLGKTATKSLCLAMEKFSKDLVNIEIPDDGLMNRQFDMEKAVEDYEQFKS